jgi:hypothetical protein
MVNQKNTLRSEVEKKRAAGQKTAAKQWKHIPKDPSEQEKFDMALRFQTHLNKSAKESYEKVGFTKDRFVLYERQKKMTSRTCTYHHGNEPCHGG